MIYTKKYNEPVFDMHEIIRYLGYKTPEYDIVKYTSDCIIECCDILSYNVCYGEFPVTITDNATVDFSYIKTESHSLAKHLNGCEKAIIFGATIGVELDRLINKYGRLSPIKALVFQAIGAERIEALCDTFCQDTKNDYPDLNLTSRFSPGYGDLNLNMQPDIFRVLDCSKKIGLTLNKSLLMSPSKSVTAIIGLTKEKTEKCEKKCNGCSNSNCEFRRD